MEGLAWDDSCKIQISLMDERNQRLMEIAAKLVELNAVKRKKEEDFEAIGEVLADMMEFARMHFNEEEKLLVGKQYPELNQHRREHKKFIKKMMGFRRLFSEDPGKVTDDAVGYVKEWLPSHIKEEDARYAPFVRVQNYLAECQAMGRRGRS
ncbi:bacteriohemerythrin [Desulfoluna sp.]|uniref:bacteriohemerythrin n=1 Tax=Desulfoluna sp. TaxID=2045199 RepID=UPI00262CC648|nr:bacteriohemerythrin [Desulfoluna sp.]